MRLVSDQLGCIGSFKVESNDIHAWGERPPVIPRFPLVTRCLAPANRCCSRGEQDGVLILRMEPAASVRRSHVAELADFRQPDDGITFIPHNVTDENGVVGVGITSGKGLLDCLKDHSACCWIKIRFTRLQESLRLSEQYRRTEVLLPDCAQRTITPQREEQQ